MSQYELAVLLEIKNRIADLPIYKRLYAEKIIGSVDLFTEPYNYCSFWFSTGFTNSYNQIRYRVYHITLKNDTLLIGISHCHAYTWSGISGYLLPNGKTILHSKTSLHDMDVIPKTITAIKNNLTLHAKHVHKRTK